MEDKKYHIDGVPSSSRDIIKMARGYDQEFADSFVQQSSTGADILRKNGHEVGDVEEERYCVKCGKTSGLIEKEDMCITCAEERGRD